MNRREFLMSTLAAFALSALPKLTLADTIPVSEAVKKQINKQGYSKDKKFRKQSIKNLNKTVDGGLLIKNLSLKNATIYGRLSGDELINAFLNADIFIFPTYGEGMPGALLEAMSFGLPVITRPVGGIPDFFINGEMGLLTDSLNATDYSQYIEHLMNNPQLALKISRNNYNYAKKHFMASIVAKNMEEIFNQITNK